MPMTESELRTLPRKLAERLGLSTSKTAKAEAVILEAIEQTLEKALEVISRVDTWREAKAKCSAAIRSLKPAKPEETKQ